MEGPIRSNKAKYCLRCGALLTKDNDSGWEGFVSGNVTQPICVVCNAEDLENFSGEKVKK